jgi:predicted nuclease of predicted toxin-antitoxin system
MRSLRPTQPTTLMTRVPTTYGPEMVFSLRAAVSGEQYFLASRMKLLIDMNLSPRWLKLLHDAAWEAEHWSHIGRPSAPDSEVMGHAAAHGYVVVAHDLDFGAILAITRGEKPSAVQIRKQGVTVERLGPTVIAALRLLSAEQGALLRIEMDRTRVRLLPFASTS